MNNLRCKKQVKSNLSRQNLGHAVHRERFQIWGLEVVKPVNPS